MENKSAMEEILKAMGKGVTTEKREKQPEAEIHVVCEEMKENALPQVVLNGKIGDITMLLSYLTTLLIRAAVAQGAEFESIKEDVTYMTEKAIVVAKNAIEEDDNEN